MATQNLNKHQFEKIILEIKTELSKKYKDFKGIYFYGSRAKDNYKKESDYDIALIFDRKIEWKFENEINDLIYNYDLKNEIIIDYKVYNEKDINIPATPFRKIVKNEGIFYGA